MLCTYDVRLVLICSSQFSAGTGGGLGFTVASPAYDHAFDPPAFLGVSGVDFTVQVRALAAAPAIDLL